MAYYKDHETQLRKKIKRLLIGIILIPVVTLVAFTYFGPTIGYILGLLSVNRNYQGPKDQLAPIKPFFKDALRATNKNTLSLTGFAEPGSVIKVFANGPETGSTIVTSDGIFIIDQISLIKGKNTIYVIAYDQNQNASDRSDDLIVIYDTDKPKIEITTPKENETIKNLDARILVTGKVNEKCIVKVNEKFAILKPDLTFEIFIGAANQGKQEIKVEAVDDAGNKEEKSFKVTYQNESL